MQLFLPFHLGDDLCPVEGDPKTVACGLYRKVGDILLVLDDLRGKAAANDGATAGRHNGVQVFFKIDDVVIPDGDEGDITQLFKKLYVDVFVRMDGQAYFPCLFPGFENGLDDVHVCFLYLYGKIAYVFYGMKKCAVDEDDIIPFAQKFCRPEVLFRIVYDKVVDRIFKTIVKFLHPAFKVMEV